MRPAYMLLHRAPLIGKQWSTANSSGAESSRGIGFTYLRSSEMSSWIPSAGAPATGGGREGL